MNGLIPTLAQCLRKRPPSGWFTLGLVYVLAVAALDYFAPGGLDFTFWYLPGVAYVAWGAGRWPALGLASIAGGAILLAERTATEETLTVVLWNAFSETLVLLGVGWLMAELARLTRNLGRLVEERTAQWQAEAERHRGTSAQLNETLARFKQIADNILEVFWIFDPAARKFLFVSQGFERIWGRPRDLLCASPEVWENALHPEDRRSLDRRGLAEKATGPYEVEYRIVRPDGAVRWVRDRAFPVLDEHGRVHRIAGLAQDITAWKTAWQTLSTQAYILENMQEAMLMAEETGTILQVNTAAEALLGYPRAELLGKRVHFLSTASLEQTQDVFESTLQQARAHGHAAGEFPLRRKDGTPIWVATQSTRLVLNEGTFLVMVGQDITERKRVDEALRLSQRSLGEALDLARLAYWEYHVGTDLFSFDDRFYRLYATTAEREGGYPMSAETYEREFLLPEDAGLVTRHLAMVLSDLGPDFSYRVEHRIRRRDGAIRHIAVRVAVTKDESGRTAQIRGVNQDITELKQAEQERSEVLELNRTLVAASPVAIAAYKASGECILANEALTHLTGGELEQLLKQNFRSLASWRRANLLSAAEETLRTGQPHGGETRLVSTFGKDVWFHYGFAAFTLRGAPHLLLLASDVTERKRSEQRLADALDLNQKMLAASLVGVIAYRATGECVFANEAVGRIIGGTVEEVLLTNFRQLRSWNDCGLFQAAEEALASGANRHGEFGMTTSFGKPVWIDVHLSAFVSAGQQHLLLMCYDISKRKRSEREVLEISDREQARIGQDLHDGLCQQLVSLAFDANNLVEQLAAKRSSQTGIARRIADLLDQSITEARNVSRGLFPVRLETDGLVPALVELAKSTSQRYGVRCTFEGNEPFGGSDRAHAIHLYRIVQEAVNNALKHGRPQAIRVELVGEAHHHELRIADDGVGFPASAVDSPHGLGLHIMQYRAHSLGGTLKIAPGAAGGTLVCCCIPRHQPVKIEA